MRMIKQNVRLLLASLFSLGTLILISGTVAAQTTVRTIPAHATVLSAIPAIGSTISQAPTKVTVSTAENINPDPKKSNLFVYGPAGEATSKLISQGNATIPLNNPKQMFINIKPDPKHLDGTYVVHWITVSADDGDPDEGAFIFTVNSGAAATPAAAVTATTGQATTPTASNNSTGGGMPIWIAAVIALVALVIGFGGGFGLTRRFAPSAGSIGAKRRDIEEQEEATKHP
jgi:methionine-rich copper-binding protein CopC